MTAPSTSPTKPKSRPKHNCPNCRQLWQAQVRLDPSIIIKLISDNYCTVQELGITTRDIRFLKDQGYNIVTVKRQDGQIAYSHLTANENASLILSGKPAKGCAETHQWVEISDVHIGCKQFDETGFLQCLTRAWNEGYRQVHISGDLLDGVNVYKGQEHNLRYSSIDSQIDYAIELLSQFDFTYIAITGNHEAAICKAGAPNPLTTIQDRMPNFFFLNTYSADLVIGGVVKRMVHIDGGTAYAKSYKAQTYLRNIISGDGTDVWIKDVNYRLRFIQVGHLHHEIIFSDAGIQFTHPLNFQLSNDFTRRKGLVGSQGCILVTTTINHKGKITEYTPKAIKPTR